MVNALNPHMSYASSNFDERQLLEFSLVYALPLFTQPGLSIPCWAGGRLNI